MSDVVKAKLSVEKKGGLRQKIFNIIGWLAFVLLIPPVLQMFKLSQLQSFLIDKLGVWGSPAALVGYFYGLLLFRVFFGSDQRLLTVLIGYLMSFLLFSNALDISFMNWLYVAAHKYYFLSYNIISLLLAIIVVFATNALSTAKKIPLWVDILLLVVLPVGALVLIGIFLAKPLGLQ